VSGHHLLGADRLPRCRPSGTLALAPASSPGAADWVRTPRDTKAGPQPNIAGDLLLANSGARVNARVARELAPENGVVGTGRPMLLLISYASSHCNSSAFIASAPRPSRAPRRGSLRSALSGRP
jgi:hypothetical protein